MCEQLLSEAAPGRVRIVHGDVLAFGMSTAFPAHTAKRWEDGKTGFDLSRDSLRDGVGNSLIYSLFKNVKKEIDIGMYVV